MRIYIVKKKEGIQGLHVCMIGYIALVCFVLLSSNLSFFGVQMQVSYLFLGILSVLKISALGLRSFTNLYIILQLPSMDYEY